MWRLSRRGNSPEKQHFHGKSSYRWIHKQIYALISSTRKPLKRKGTHIIPHFRSVQTGVFRSVASLPSKFVKHFSRNRRHTILFGLQTFNMGETDINPTDVINSFNEGSDMRNKKAQNDVPSFIKNCKSKTTTSHQHTCSVSFTLVIQRCDAHATSS
jgi:hypothetical protein